MSSLITALSLEGPDGVQVTLMQPGYRNVRRIEGLAGVRVRKAKRPRTGRNGSVDRTKLRDDAQVVITGLVYGEDADRAWLEYDTITRALVGAVDTDRLLMWSAGTSRHLQMNVRLDESQAPVEVGPDMVAYQVILSGSDPNGYSQTLVTASAVPTGGTGGGMTFPEIMPITFSPSSGGAVAIDNTGTAPTPPTIVLTGYLRDPIVRLGDRELVFDGEIADGDELYIDVANRTVLLNGTANRINMLRFEVSRWFDLPVGGSIVTLLAEDFSGAAGIEVQYRPAYE
jgi:hypothetical protein